MAESRPPAARREDDVRARDVACAVAVLEAADEGPTGIGIFTDEDLLALDGLSQEQVVPLPWMTENEDSVSTEIAASVALRSLIARRLVIPAELLADSFEQIEGNARRMYAVDPVQGILTLRRSTEALSTFQRVVEGGVHTIVHYLFDEGRALEEEITADGYHHFAVMPVAAVPERLLVLIDQDDVAGADGEPFSLASSAIPTDPALDAMLSDTRALTVGSLIRRDGTMEQYTFYATSERLLAACADVPDGVDPADVDDPVMTFVEVSDETAQRMVGLLLDSAMPAADGDGSGNGSA